MIVIGGIIVILIAIDVIQITSITHTISDQEFKMRYYNYRPYPYYRRYYNLDPYYYRRYYYPPFYNIVDSNIANVDQNITNFGDMTDVIQDSVIYQSLTPPNQTS